jgi:hypothetical protein
MGSPKTNFYNEAYRRGGWDQAAAEVQELWVAGRRDEAIARVPAEMIIQANLLGDEAGVRERMRPTVMPVSPPAGAAGRSDYGASRLDTLGRVMDLIRFRD